MNSVINSISANMPIAENAIHVCSRTPVQSVVVYLLRMRFMVCRYGVSVTCNFITKVGGLHKSYALFISAYILTMRRSMYHLLALA